MNNPYSPKSKYFPYTERIRALYKGGMPIMEISQTMIDMFPEVFPASLETTRKVIGAICKKRFSTQNTLSPLQVDPSGDVHWKEIIEATKSLQSLSSRASNETNRFTMAVEADRPVCLVFLSDLHLGAIGTDYDQFMRVTDEIIETEDLYIILGGDEVNFAVKFRSISEIREDLISPELQLRLLESWITDVGHKVVASVSGNHDAWRTSNTTGLNPFKELFKGVAPYGDGICHSTLKVNDNEYKLAFSHLFKGHSQWNPLHAGIKYATMKGQDREIIMSGHTHQPGHSTLYIGGKKRVIINSGTLQKTSQYGRRFFGISTNPAYPCVILNHERKDFMSSDSIKWYLDNF